MNIRLNKNEDGLDEIDLTDKIKVELVSYETDLVKLNKEDFLPRYNTLKLLVENNSDETIDNLLLSVFRVNSKIGDDNFYVILIKTYDLKPDSKGQYVVKVFDWFNEKFECIEIRLATTEDWVKRKRISNWRNKESVDNWINEGKETTKRVDSWLLKLFK